MLLPERYGVTGRDLIADGMKPGKDLGAVLSELLGEVLRDPSHNTKEYLLEYSRTPSPELMLRLSFFCRIIPSRIT